jgi:hypothetical protein
LLEQNLEKYIACKREKSRREREIERENEGEREVDRYIEGERERVRYTARVYH